MANTKTGQVIKNVNAQTITVSVTAYKIHPLYKKRYIYSKKYLVHDPKGQAQLEDKVVIRQSRPFSRRKCWLLEKVVTRGGHTAAVKSDLRAFEPESVTAEQPVKKDETFPTPTKAPAKAPAQASTASSKIKDNKKTTASKSNKTVKAEKKPSKPKEGKQ